MGWRQNHGVSLKWLCRVNRALLLAVHYIGGRTKDGLYYLDISVPVDGYEQAMEVARRNRQETIYHPASDTVYRVEPEESPVVITSPSSCVSRGTRY
jgi:hypothetical protein